MPPILPPLIGLTGPAGCGKDTVRSMLEMHHGYHGLALSDPIRSMITSLLRTACADANHAHARELKERPIPGLGVSYRHLAQTLGTEWGRETISPELWTSIAGMRMAELVSDNLGPINFVVSDIRFESEAQWLRQRGGVIWEIMRPRVQAVRAHTSEAGIAHAHISQTLCNDGNIADLHQCVQSALAHFAAAP